MCVCVFVYIYMIINITVRVIVSVCGHECVLIHNLIEQIFVQIFFSTGPSNCRHICAQLCLGAHHF